jgi:ABC-type uncharacterized transport system substrate-binding protein
VLQGANPADLHVEQVDRLQLIVNMTTVKLLGLKIPESLRQRVDEIVQ